MRHHEPESPLAIAQRVVNRFPVEQHEPRFPLPKLMDVCEEAALVNVHGAAFGAFDRAASGSEADDAWHHQKMMLIMANRLAYEVAQYNYVARALAGDARVLGSMLA